MPNHFQFLQSGQHIVKPSCLPIHMYLGQTLVSVLGVNCWHYQEKKVSFGFSLYEHISIFKFCTHLPLRLTIAPSEVLKGLRAAQLLMPLVNISYHFSLCECIIT